jgi:tetratricopeptide (TPR) repeat protein
VFAVGSEPKAVAAKITIEYEVSGNKRDITRTATFSVYNRNAIVWDDMRKMAAFVTPRDESVKGIVSMVSLRDIALPGKGGKPGRTVRAPQFASAKALSQAAAYFDALGASGISYVSDPTAPFQYFDGNAEAVDYIAYPAETLGRKTGDCDDLTALYSSMLESAGIPTALVDVPGHVFLMFDSGLTPEEARLYNNNDAFYVRNGTAWVPVEVTAVGKSFKEAWALAAVEVKKWSGLDQLKPVDVLAAQSEFPSSPPALAKVDPKTGFDDKLFAKLVTGDAALADKEEEGRQTRIAEIKGRKTLSEPAKLNEIGIVYARDGLLKDAENYFTQAMNADPRLFKAYNNLANVKYLLSDFEGAIKAYDQALSVGGDQAAVLINMASLYYEKGDKVNAKLYFDRAARLEPVYEKEYPELAAVSKGDDSKVASRTGGTGVSKAAGVGAGEKDPRRSRWIP